IQDVPGRFIQKYNDNFISFSFFFQAEDGIRDFHVTGVQTCALPISMRTGGSHGEAPWQPHDPRAAGQTPNRSATQAEAACATPHTVLAEKWADENARIAGRGTGRKRRGPAPSAVEQVTTRDGRLAGLGSRY